MPLSIPALTHWPKRCAPLLNLNIVETTAKNTLSTMPW